MLNNALSAVLILFPVDLLRNITSRDQYPTRWLSRKMLPTQTLSTILRTDLSPGLSVITRVKSFIVPPFGGKKVSPIQAGTTNRFQTGSRAISVAQIGDVSNNTKLAILFTLVFAASSNARQVKSWRTPLTSPTLTGAFVLRVHRFDPKSPSLDFQV